MTNFEREVFDYFKSQSVGTWINEIENVRIINSEYLSLICIEEINQYPQELIYRLKKESYDTNKVLIVLWKDHWITKNAIVKSRINSFFKKNNTIFARKTIIKQIDNQTAINFLDQNHLQGGTKSKHKLGLFYNNELVSVATFGPSLWMKNEAEPYLSFPWIRYANLLNHNVVGGMSKLLKYFVEHYHPQGITTYVDFDWANGNSYKKLGFELIEFTPCQTFYLNEEFQRIYPHKIGDTEILDNNQFTQVYNTGNLKLIKRF